MTYLSLARKWRPQLFEDVIGQEHITKTLQNAISTNRVAQAYLFTGSRGVGKTTSARILAKAMNCVEGPTPTPCNKCTSCIEISENRSPDVLEIDGASNNSVDDIRNLQEQINYKPTKGKYRIYIIDEVHMLSTSAFNALLKTLEEPPPHVIFIFATTEPHKIPITILSRCQRFDFKNISRKSIKSRLKYILEQEKIVPSSEESLDMIAKAADGSMRDALSILDQLLALDKTLKLENVEKLLGLTGIKETKEIVNTLINRETDKLYEIIENTKNSGIELKFFLKEMLSYLQDLIHYELNLPNNIIEPPAFITDIDIEELFHIFNSLIKSTDDILSSSFPEMRFEITLLEIIHRPKLVQLENLISMLKNPKNDIPQKKNYQIRKNPIKEEKYSTRQNNIPQKNFSLTFDDLERAKKILFKNKDFITLSMALSIVDNKITLEISNSRVKQFVENKEIFNKFQDKIGELFNGEKINIINNNKKPKDINKEKKNIYSKFNDEPELKKFTEEFDLKINKIEIPD